MDVPLGIFCRKGGKSRGQPEFSAYLNAMPGPCPLEIKHRICKGIPGNFSIYTPPGGKKFSVLVTRLEPGQAGGIGGWRGQGASPLVP